MKSCANPECRGVRRLAAVVRPPILSCLPVTARRAPSQPLSRLLNTFTNALCLMAVFCVSMLWSTACLGADLDPIQRLILDGQFSAGAAERGLAKALESDPGNPRLLYNHAVAAYAAGKWEEALLSLDKVESRGRRPLVRKARFQKGNTEFRLGLAMRDVNMDETIGHWRQSIDYYREVLKETPADRSAATNLVTVRRMLVDLLLDAARRSESAAALAERQNPRKEQVTDRQLQQLRNAFEKFSEARQADPESREATEGEQRLREQLARALAKEGSRRASIPPSLKVNPREPSLPLLNIQPVEEGVGMVQDADQLKPNDPGIQGALKQGKEKLADAHTQQAQTYLSLEERIPIPREKFAVLRMAKESAEKALDHVPEHKRAQQTMEEINRRLANLHEEQGDTLSKLSENQNLENQAMMLSQSLDNYQQAGELRPNEKRLQQKAQQTQQKLESALDQLGDKLMQSKNNESLEQQIARLEGAQQAFNELMGLNPSEKTGKKAEAAGRELDGAREELARQGRSMPNGNDGDQPMPGQGQMQMSQGMPQDAPPKINTPGMKGPWSSPTMYRTLRDY